MMMTLKKNLSKKILKSKMVSELIKVKKELTGSLVLSQKQMPKERLCLLVDIKNNNIGLTY
jgi:hypothetical protein